MFGLCDFCLLCLYLRFAVVCCWYWCFVFCWFVVVLRFPCILRMLLVVIVCIWLLFGYLPARSRDLCWWFVLFSVGLFYGFWFLVWLFGLYVGVFTCGFGV